jgi:hypothetical protein
LRPTDDRRTPELVGELIGRSGSLACCPVDEPTKLIPLEIPRMDEHSLRPGLTGLRLRLKGDSAIAVGIPVWNNWSGGVFVFESSTGRLLSRFDVLAGEPNTDDFSTELGYALLSVPHLDGDGKDDIVMSGPEYGLENGVVIDWSPSTGKVIWQVIGESFGNIGTSLDLLDDVDGDGVRDLLVGGGDHALSNGRFKRNGTVRVLSGANGNLLDIVYEADYPQLRGATDEEKSK